MRETVESEKMLVVFISITPFRLTLPLKKFSPLETSRGKDSPVKADVFKLALPLTIVPSSGTRSPGWTMMISPSLTSSGDTVINSFPRLTCAWSGRMSISAAMDLRDLLTA